MALLLILKDILYSDQDTRLLHVAKLIIDGCAEISHRAAQADVGIDEGRDVFAHGTYALIEDTVILLEVGTGEE